MVHGDNQTSKTNSGAKLARRGVPALHRVPAPLSHYFERRILW